jgi:co-chaperonin GroES (HSP10)
MSMMMNAMVHLNWHHDDPEQARDEILAALGDLSWFRLIGSQVLLGDYMRPVTTRGGIIAPDSAQNEDVFQGVVGMIVAYGPQAWKEGDEERFGGVLPKIGDWVYCRPQDTVACVLKGPRSMMEIDPSGKRKRGFEGWPCRLAFARDLYAFTDLPHAVI